MAAGRTNPVPRVRLNDFNELRVGFGGGRQSFRHSATSMGLSVMSDTAIEVALGR
jgi:hypothetical protein